MTKKSPPDKKAAAKDGAPAKAPPANFYRMEVIKMTAHHQARKAP